MSLKTRDELLSALYQLVLASDISENERQVFLKAKSQLEEHKDFSQTVSQLKVELSPLALQFKLSPESLAFYSELQKDFPVRDKLWRPSGLFF